MRVVVVGGGITGLTAALTLLDLAPGTDVAVVEADDRLGGRIRTEPFAGRPVDCAADAFLARVPDAVALCERLGLRDRLVSPARRNAYLYARGALRAFPEGLVLGVPTDLDALTRSGVLSPEGVDRAAADLTMGPEPDARSDESVGSLVRRRLGDEVYEVLVGPLLSGVNAGDADWLSVAAGAPQLAAGLRDHGSLIAGARAQRAAAAAVDPDAPVFYALPTGTATLVDALARAITDAGGSITTRRVARSLERGDDAWHLTVTDARSTGDAAGDRATAVEGADAVLLCSPLAATARLLTPLAPAVAAEMAEVEYASAVMVTLALPKAAIDHPLDASGFLVAEREGLLLTACSWASSKWAHLDLDDRAILRASAGRHHDRRALELDDGDLVDALLADLAITMGLRGRPDDVRVTRWPESLPQFRPGHLDRVRAWRSALAEAAPGVVAAGAGLEGLGIPACIRQGREAASALVAN